MLTVTHPAPNRLDLELSGVMDADMMTAALDDILTKAKTIEDGVMMYRIPSFVMPTGGAILTELMRLPDLFGLIGHFDKCAVVTDITWIQAAAAVEGALIPGLDIKAFDLDQSAEAEAWLTEGNEFDNLPV